MEDTNNPVENSQVIDPIDVDAGAQGKTFNPSDLGDENAQPKAEKPEKPLSTRDAIAKAIKDTSTKADAKPDANADPKKGNENGKEDRADNDSKSAKAEQPAGKSDKQVDGDKVRAEGERGSRLPKGQVDQERGADEAASSESQRDGRGAPNESRTERKPFDDAPARLLPVAREKWANVPTVVKEDLHRIMREHESEVSRFREIGEKYSKLAPYEQMATQYGSTLDEALSRYTSMEKEFLRDPSSGFKELMHNLQMQPEQAIGHIIRSLGVTPQQLAQHLGANPHLYSSQAPRPQPAQQPNPVMNEVQSLKQEIQSMRTEAVVKDLTATVIEPFVQEHPDYFEHENEIAELLQSGIIDKLYPGLSHRQKLAEAYRMAGGKGPQQQRYSSEQPVEDTQADTSRPVDPDGKLSTRGSPNGGNSSQRRKFESNRSALEAAFAQHNR